MAPKRNLNFGSLSPLPSASTRGAVVQMKNKKRAGRFTSEDALKIARAVLYLCPRYASIAARKRGELPFSTAVMFSRLKLLLGFQHHPRSIMHYFKRWRFGNEQEWEAMKEEAEANGEGYFDELAQLEEDLIESGELEDDRMEIEEGDNGSKGDEHSASDHETEPLPTRRRKPQRNKNAGHLTTEDKLNIARAVIYLRPRYTRRQGRKRNSTELPIGSHAMFRRMKTLLSYQQHPDSIMKCFRHWRLENMAEWEAMKEEAEANGEGYFDDWAQLEEDLIERGELDDNRIGMEDGDEVSNRDGRSIGGSDQQMHVDYEPSEPFFPAQEEETEFNDGQTTYIHFETAQPDAQPESGEDGECYMDYVVEDANSDEDDVRQEDGRDQPGVPEGGNAPQIVHNEYHFHGPVMIVPPGWIPPQ